MSEKEKWNRLRCCFYAGYNLPQFCMDNGYTHPLVIASIGEALYEIYAQFRFYKGIQAEYRIIGEAISIDYSYGNNIAKFNPKPFCKMNFDEFDIVLLLTDSETDLIPKSKLLKFGQILFMMQRYVFAERPIYDFINRNPNVKVITYTHPNMIENEYNSEVEKKVLEYNYKRELQKNWGGIWTPLDKFGYTNDEVRRLLSMPETQTDYQGCTSFKNSSDKLLQIKNGKRKTANQPTNYENTIYCIGTCVCVGYAAPYDKTMLSYLQNILNDNRKAYKVENVSQFFNGRYQDAFYNLNSLSVKNGDIVFICISNQVLRDIPSFYEKKLFVRPHNYGEIYIDKHHVNERGYRIIAEKFYDFLEENNWFDDYDYHTELISRAYYRPRMYGIPEWTDERRKNIGIPDELMKYKKMLQEVKVDVSGKIGAIVMNCNPFTLGHRYLVETASKSVEHLYVFAVQEDKSIFPFEERIDLMRKGTSDLNNVTVLPSGKFIISALTFSDYFNKSDIQDSVIDASMDVHLFATQIAPELNIVVRFAGEEPLDKVTQQYNETMKTILPEHGIEFIEIPRKEEGGAVISASRVRKLLKNREFEQIKQLVPQSTLEYLIQRENDSNEIEQRIDLSKIDNFENYIDKLKELKDSISVFIVSKDAHTKRRENEITHKLLKLKEIGIMEDLESAFRYSFLGVIENGHVKKEIISEEKRLEYIQESNGNKVLLISEGYSVKKSNRCEGKVVINGKQYAVGDRGLNFVVWSQLENRVIDSVCFDFFSDGCARRKLFELEKINLNQISDFENYIEKLVELKEEINIFIVSKDAHTKRVPDEITYKLSNLKKLGILTDLEKKYRYSFLGSIQNGKLKEEAISEKDRLVCIEEIENNRVMMISEGYNVKDGIMCDGKIIINKKQCAVDKRGLNFVIWSRTENKVIDSVCFDFFSDGSAYRKEL